MLMYPLRVYRNSIRGIPPSSDVVALNALARPSLRAELDKLTGQTFLQELYRID